MCGCLGVGTPGLTTAFIPFIMQIPCVFVLFPGALINATLPQTKSINFRNSRHLPRLPAGKQGWDLSGWVFSPRDIDQLQSMTTPHPVPQEL